MDAAAPPPPHPRSPAADGWRKKHHHGKRRPYLPPVLEVGSRLTFGASSECLPSPALSAPGDGHLPPLPRSVAFGKSRRMSRSLPELREMDFVAVLPGVREEAEGEEGGEGEEGASEGCSEFEEEVVFEKAARVAWHRKLDFVWCSVCHALGLSNIWRFPYYCYGNGGGSFVLPYLIFMVICGVPMLCMELAVGQLTQSGPIAAFGQLCPLLKGIGVASMMLSFWVTTYYSILTSWTFFYFFNSFYSPPRWSLCSNKWNTEFCYDPSSTEPEASDSPSNSSAVTPVAAEIISSNTSSVPELVFLNVSFLNTTHPAEEFLNIKMLDRSTSIDDSGEIRFELLASVLFVWILIYIALRKTDFFRGTTICVMTIVTHLLLFSIFLRTVALEGGKSGLKQLFTPEWEQMLKPRTLLYALAQAFHSLGVVLGPSILMGSCHKQYNNLLRDTIILTIVTLLTVLIVGCFTFATIGHIAVKMNKPFFSALEDDPGNVFVLYSVVIASMPLPSCWGVVFFLVLLFLGLDSEVKLMATLVSALKEAYTYYIKQRFQGHSLFLAVVCGFCFAACILYVTQAGIFFFQLIDHYTAVLATSVVALLEVFTLSWLYGSSNLSSCIRQMTGKPPSYYYHFCWVILSPLTILVVLIYGFIKMSDAPVKKDYLYPQWAHIIGWILFALSLSFIPLLAVAAFKRAPGRNITNKLKATIMPRLRSASETMWEPKPIIILNSSNPNDYKPPDLPAVPNAVQSYVDKHSSMHQNDETAF